MNISFEWTDFLTVESAVLIAAIVAWPIFRWSFKNLPDERWQFAAILPSRMEHEGWLGTNVTFYGVISAIAYSVGSALFIFLNAALGQPIMPIITFALLVLAVAIPASKRIARWVEGVSSNFSIAGALFAVAVTLPLTLSLTTYIANIFGWGLLNGGALLAAGSIAYVLGEAIGRLGCLSFGCCYGKALDKAGPLERALYSNASTVYRGQMKKIAYAGNMENTPVLPVQSVASVVLFVLCLLGTWLFWHQRFALAVAATIGGSQLWRVYSETLRADFRGAGKISAYTWMSLVTCVFASVCTYLWSSPSGASSAHFIQGWQVMSRAEMLIALQALALGIIWYMGRSQVTVSHGRFRIRPKVFES